MMVSETATTRQDFMAYALRLVAMGLTPVLLHPASKEPVFLSYNLWQHGVASSVDLEIPENKRPSYFTDATIKSWWMQHPNGNIGVLCREVHALDLDAEWLWSNPAISSLIPTTPCFKRGRRGWTFLYRPDPQDPVRRSRSFVSKLNDEMLIEVLASGTRFTVMPPSIHPDTQQPYTWPDGARVLGDITLAELPTITQGHVDALEGELRRQGYLSTHLARVHADDGVYWGNQDRYAQWFGIKVADKVDLVRLAGEGSRQQTLNDAVLSMAAGVRVGALGRDDLEAEMRAACHANGYLQERGDKLWQRDFDKALDDGWENPLPDLGERTGPDHSLGAQDVFAGRPVPDRGSMPTSPPPEAPVVLKTRLASDYEGQAVPSRSWSMLDVIPKGQISTLYGEPGKGKTTLLMQYAIKAATGGVFFGKPVLKHRGVLFIAAEDDEQEMHFRLAEICKAYGVTMPNIHLLVMDEQNMDNTDLSRVVGDRSMPTPMMDAVEGIVREHGIDLVLMDPVGDLFGGNENDKLQVRSFMQMIRRRLCVKLGATVIMAAHPSRGSARMGDGQAGSTAWSGSARARLFFEELPDSGGCMKLSLQKANRSSKWEVGMKWVKGVFVGYDAKSEPDAVHPAQEAIIQDIANMRFVWRSDHRATNWIGTLFEKHTGRVMATKEGRAEVKGWTLKWITQGLIREVMVKDPKNRMDRPFIDIMESESASVTKI